MASHTDVVYFVKGNFCDVGLIFFMVTSVKGSPMLHLKNNA